MYLDMIPFEFSLLGVCLPSWISFASKLENFSAFVFSNTISASFFLNSTCFEIHTKLMLSCLEMVRNVTLKFEFKTNIDGLAELTPSVSFSCKSVSQ
jgi:hypothetical protein